MTVSRMTGADHLSMLTRILGNPPTTRWSTNELVQLIHQAEIFLAGTIRPKVLLTTTTVTTTSGTSNYALGVSDCLWMEPAAMNTTYGVRVLHHPYDDYQRKSAGIVTPTGTVQWWTEVGVSSTQRQIYFHPQPFSTQAIVFTYGKVPTGVVCSPTANATSSDLPQECDLLIAQWAAILTTPLDKMFTEAKQWESVLAPMVALAVRLGSTPIEVRRSLETIVGQATRGRR